MIDVLIQLSRVDAELRASGRSDPDARVEALARRRDALLSALPRELAAVYQQVARAGRHPAATALADGYCAGCHVRLPSQLATALARDHEIGRCPHCQRLLYPRAS